MPLPTQARLLRVLQSRSIQPLGSGEPVTVDIRVVSASNRDLADAVRTGRFREDLYYRVAGLTLSFPALRERSDRRALIEQVHARHLAPGQPRQLPSNTLELLLHHPWPGNLRQLNSVLQVALALAGTQPIGIEHFSACFLAQASAFTPSPQVAATQTPATDLAHLLNTCDGNISALARVLGISRTTLYKRLREQGLEPSHL